MRSISAIVFSYLLNVFPLVFSDDYIQKGCPHASEIKPCVCEEQYTYEKDEDGELIGQTTYWMECENIVNIDRLRKIFLHTDRYSLNEVSIKNSTIAYLPHELFERFIIKRIRFSDVRMIQLFDEPLKYPNIIKYFNMENVSLQRHLDWKLLENLYDLRYLMVMHTHFKVIGENFRKYVNKNLRNIIFSNTGTKRIVPGALADFNKLELMMFDGNELTKIVRKIFPEPSSLKYITFNDNRITYIEDDAFEYMPKLYWVSLKNNFLVIIPESAFRGSNPQTVMLSLEGNPLRCNCTLQWIVKPTEQGNRPNHHGSCASPPYMENKTFTELTFVDFPCQKHTSLTTFLDKEIPMPVSISLDL